MDETVASAESLEKGDTESPPTVRSDVASEATQLDGTQRAEPVGDAVSAALALALEKATSAGRWNVVAQLAKELEARRVASAGNVVVLASRRAQR